MGYSTISNMPIANTESIQNSDTTIITSVFVVTFFVTTWSLLVHSIELNASTYFWHFH